MEIEIKIDSSRTEPKIIIETAVITKEVQDLAHRLSMPPDQILTGAKDGMLSVLEESQLIRCYASGKNVFAATAEGTYTLRLRLYELEQRLNSHQFVRISNSEIVNLAKVENFDLSLAGTIRVKLKNGTVTWASRRYVPKIKQILGITR